MRKHRTGRTETEDKVLDFSERGSIALQLRRSAIDKEEV